MSTDTQIRSLSGKEAQILGLLNSRGHMYGSEMVRTSPGLSGGTVPSVLRNLQRVGLVSLVEEKSRNGKRGRPTKIYAITQDGARALARYRGLSPHSVGAK